MEIYENISDLLKSINIFDEQKIKDFFLLKIDPERYLNSEIRYKEPYKNNFFAIVITTNRDTNVKIGDAEIDNSKNNISFSSKNQLVSWNSIKYEKGVTYIFFFNPEFVGFDSECSDIYQELPYFNIYTSPFYSLSENKLNSLMEIAEKIFEEQVNFTNLSEEIIKSYFRIFLFNIKRMLEPVNFTDGSVNRQQEIAFHFENLIKNTVNKRKPIAEYAKELNISQVYLSECIKKTTDKSAKKIIDEYLIADAKSLLFQTYKPVSEIAASLGFDDLSNFVKYFKTQTQMTPKAFRDKIT